MKPVDPFQVVTVEPCPPLDPEAGGKWYRYVIANCHTRITGSRRSTLRQARLHADEFADTLNARAEHGVSTWTQRSRTARSKSK